jgi:NADPH-dependent curcumin reductase CurA
MKAENTRIVLARRPNGFPVEEDFRIERAKIPVPHTEELLLQNLFISLTPGDRLYMNRAIELGGTIRAHTIAKVVDPNGSQIFAQDDLVLARGGWQRFFVAAEDALERISAECEPVTVNLGVLGPQGLTAYFGLLSVGNLAAGETVLVSGATGVVGSAAGQIARIRGCRVVGICSDDEEKRRWLRDTLHFDALADESNLEQSLISVCPDGVDIFFDNVGGETLDAALRLIGKKGKKNARVVCCGMVSQYNRHGDEEPYGVCRLHTLINKRIRMQGFVVGDYRQSYPSALEALARWLREGRIKYKEDITLGLKNAPQAFIRLMTRSRFGKCLVKVDET